VLFSYFSDAKHNNILNKAIQYAHITFIASLIGAVLFFILTFFAIPLLYGKEFSEAGWMIGILLLGVLPFTITTILASFFAGTNRLFINFRTSLIGLVFAAIGYIFDSTLGSYGRLHCISN
jgi:O-antigen/teichoic acid export membrane protein